MKHELWYSVVVRDRQGKVVSRERRRSRSFVKQYNQLLYAAMFQGSLAGVLDYEGVETSSNNNAYSFSMIGLGAIYPGEEQGIVYGTGDRAVAIDDYQLEALIVDGVGAGQLEYEVYGTVTDVSLVDSSAEFMVSRTAINNSGDTITVKEVGVHTMIRHAPPNNKYGLIVRDVLETPQAIPNGGAITVDFTFRRTV